MNKQYMDELINVLMKIHEKEDMPALLRDLLTPSELQSVVERVQIFKMLKQGVPHRTISQKLKVSIAKVTRGSHAWQTSKSINNLL